MRRIALVLLLAVAGCAEKEPCDEPHSCPANGTIDCMPVVPKDRAALCSGECRQWITAHCPGVSYTD